MTGAGDTAKILCHMSGNNGSSTSSDNGGSPASDGGGGETMAEEEAGRGCAVLAGIFARNLGGYKPQVPPSYGGVTLEDCCAEAFEGGMGCIRSLGSDYKNLIESAPRETGEMSVESYIKTARKKTASCCASAQTDLFELRHAGTVSCCFAQIRKPT